MATANPIHIDLRTDLPKVREFANREEMGKCKYASPCAIGAMMPEDRRARFDRGQLHIGVLLDRGSVIAPSDQHDDLLDLQQPFDSNESGEFDRVLAKLEAKYLPKAAA